jgi:hypothetical protein
VFSSNPRHGISVASYLLALERSGSFGIVSFTPRAFAKPLGSPEAPEDFSERPAVYVVAGRTVMKEFASQYH